MTSRVSLNLSPLSPIPSQPKLSKSLPPIHSKFDEKSPSSYDQESDIFDDIPITLVLPDGGKFKLIVKTGETVQEIKRKLDTLHGIPYSDATLYYNGTCMIDPLSLNDFPGLVSKTNVCLDVKISHWPRNNNAQSDRVESNKEIYNNHLTPRKDYDIISTPSTNSLHSISFIEYDDTRTNNGIGFGGLEENLETTPTPLPNAFSDSPTMDKLSRRRADIETKSGTTTIDVVDDDPQCKEIQKLGGSRRWKLCFLF